MAMAARRSITAEAVLDVAVDLFSSKGLSGTTLDDVARRLGITRQGVLHYFPGKQALFVAVLERDKQWAAKRAWAPIAEGESPLHSLGHFLGTTPESHARVRLQLVLQGEAIAGNPTAVAYMQERAGTIRRQVESRVREADGLGLLAPGWSIDTATTVLIALVNGLQTTGQLEPGHDIQAALHAAVNHIAPTKADHDEN